MPLRVPVITITGVSAILRLRKEALDVAGQRADRGKGAVSQRERLLARQGDRLSEVTGELLFHGHEKADQPERIQPRGRPEQSRLGTLVEVVLGGLDLIEIIDCGVDRIQHTIVRIHSLPGRWLTAEAAETLPRVRD